MCGDIVHGTAVPQCGRYVQKAADDGRSGHHQGGLLRGTGQHGGEILARNITVVCLHASGGDGLTRRGVHQHTALDADGGAAAGQRDEIAGLQGDRSAGGQCFHPDAVVCGDGKNAVCLDPCAALRRADCSVCRGNGSLHLFLRPGGEIASGQQRIIRRAGTGRERGADAAQQHKRHCKGDQSLRFQGGLLWLRGYAFFARAARASASSRLSDR